MSGQELVDELRAYERAHRYMATPVPGGVRRPDHEEEANRYRRAADRIEALEAEVGEAHTHFAIQEGRIRQAYEAQDFWRQRAAELEAELAATQQDAANQAAWKDNLLAQAKVNRVKERGVLVEAIRRETARAERAEQKSAELAAVIAEALADEIHIEAVDSQQWRVAFERVIRILSTVPADALSAYATRVREEAGVKADRLDSLVRWVDHTLTLPIYQNPRKGSEAETVAAEYRHWRRLLTNGLHPSALAKLAEAAPWSEIPEGQN